MQLPADSIWFDSITDPIRSWCVFLNNSCYIIQEKVCLLFPRPWRSRPGLPTDRRSYWNVLQVISCAISSIWRIFNDSLVVCFCWPTDVKDSVATSSPENRLLLLKSREYPIWTWTTLSSTNKFGRTSPIVSPISKTLRWLFPRFTRPP